MHQPIHLQWNNRIDKSRQILSANISFPFLVHICISKVADVCVIPGTFHLTPLFICPLFRTVTSRTLLIRRFSVSCSMLIIESSSHSSVYLPASPILYPKRFLWSSVSHVRLPIDKSPCPSITPSLLPGCFNTDLTEELRVLFWADTPHRHMSKPVLYLTDSHLSSAAPSFY